VGQRLIEGRDFTTADLDATQPVAIVNADFAQKHFGRESALGRRFRTGDGSTPQYGPWRTIVGVVSTVRMIGPGTNPRVDLTGFYVPFYSTPTGPAPASLVPNQFATVLVTPRGGQSPAGLVEVLRREVARADAHLPLYFVGTPAHHLAAATSVNRVIAIMFSAFGVVAVVLSAVGLYGVMSFAVSQRTQEFGVRMALGADQSTILSMVLRQGSRQIALGLGLGLALSLGLAQLLRDGISNMLFGVSASDPLTYVSVTLLVLVVSVVAVLDACATRDARTPMTALRLEVSVSGHASPPCPSSGHPRRRAQTVAQWPTTGLASRPSTRSTWASGRPGASRAMPPPARDVVSSRAQQPPRARRPKRSRRRHNPSEEPRPPAVERLEPIEFLGA
jgi:hypothetical protein